MAYARLPRFDARDEARHLFYADGFLRLGLPPRVLMSAQGLDTSQLDLLKAGYNPYQPRVPAGRGRTSGQWASDEEGSSTPASTAVSSAPTNASAPTSRTRPRSPAAASEAAAAPQPDHVSADALPFIQPIADKEWPGYPIDLREEEQRGGHAIRDHVGKSKEYLLSVVRDIAQNARANGDFFRGMSEGSFPSLEAANKLINSTVNDRENQPQVRLVIQGVLPRATLDKDFPSPTGYEAYAETERSKPYIRDTYGVRVIIRKDPTSANGYRIISAFPIDR